MPAMSDLPFMCPVPRFLEIVGISKTTWWRLRKRGEAPRLLRLGSRYFITQESALEWMRAREAQLDGVSAHHG